MKRKILAALLTLVMVFSLLPVSAWAEETTYSDVAGHWAQSAILRWSDYGVLQGSEGKFSPDGTLTRGQMAVILSRLLNLSAAFEGGRLDVMTMRRYTPGDSTLSGLMLTPSVADADGAPMDAHYTLSATSGIFMKWDALLGTYVTVGTTAESDGETVVWSDQTPAADAKDPVVSIALTQAGAQTTLAEAKLLLRVDGEGYLIEDDALTIH